MTVYGENCERIPVGRGSEEERRFLSLDEMLTYVRSLPRETWERRTMNLGGPGYTVGSVAHTMDGKLVLHWRNPVKLDQPRTYCEECGSDDIQRGRCKICGETDMIRTEWTSWEEHREIL
jgi:hypothetical protein